MFNIIHNFIPQEILFDGGWFKIYYYGLIMSLAIGLSFFTALKLGKRLKIKSDDVFDLGFFLVIAGLIGARVYDIFLFFPYYINKPLAIFKVWEGGLAIHGAIIAGFLTLIIFAKKKNISFWKLSTVIAPALAIGQAIGRFGNYFNQELFGLPSNLPWSIPIEFANRPLAYENFSHFHPTFLYESLGSLIIFSILFFYIIKRLSGEHNFNQDIFPLSFYVLSYSLLRFILEFIKIDDTPSFIGLRFPQIISLAMIIATLIFIIRKKCFSEKNPALK